MAMPSSPAAGWIQTFSNPPSRAMRPLATQFSATPPAMQRFLAPVVSRSQRVRASSTFSVSSCTRQARSSQCRIAGCFSQSPAPMKYGCLNSAFQDGTRSSPPSIVEQALDLVAAAIGRKTHQLAALVPVAEHIGRGAAVQRAQPRHGVKLLVEHAARRLQPDLLQAFELRAGEAVIALGFPRERIALVVSRRLIHRVGAIAADAIDDHHCALFERRGGKGAVGVRQMMRDRNDLVGVAAEVRMLRGLLALGRRHEARHVLVGQPRLHVGHRHDVAIAHDQIDVVERDAFGFEAIVDHLLVESGGVFFARQPLLADRKCDGAVAQQTRADVVVIGVETKDIRMLFGHWHFLEGNAFALKRTIVSRLGLRGGILLEALPQRTTVHPAFIGEADFSNVYERLACLTLL